VVGRHNRWQNAAVNDYHNNRFFSNCSSELYPFSVTNILYLGKMGIFSEVKKFPDGLGLARGRFNCTYVMAKKTVFVKLHS